MTSTSKYCISSRVNKPKPMLHIHIYMRGPRSSSIENRMSPVFRSVSIMETYSVSWLTVTSRGRLRYFFSSKGVDLCEIDFGFGCKLNRLNTYKHTLNVPVELNLECQIRLRVALYVG
ncbi:hypothetical protein QE152_g24313 [Popillia japonica]|uniref:Uncharacterized protein n=1 Tax=Popillia japonica TaxID=7064 RepID=A0AAW1KC53_POPJA